ncbi:MAG: cupin domain-containing protein [Pseudomonadota bacterium]|nr:cupin domain-containing protein [Pseudomonadota bacterium]
MIPSIQHGALLPEHYTEERCHIVEMSNSADDPAASIARARVEPGVTTRWHRLRDIAERYVILQGEGRVEIGDTIVQIVGAGDTVLIPLDCAQRISNVGKDDLVFLAICTPRFEWGAYSSWGD